MTITLEWNVKSSRKENNQASLPLNSPCTFQESSLNLSHVTGVLSLVSIGGDKDFPHVEVTGWSATEKQSYPSSVWVH